MEGLLPSLVRGAAEQQAHHAQRVYHAAGVHAGDRYCHHRRHVRSHRILRHAPPGTHRPDGGEQHPHDERGHRHRCQPVPAVRGVLQRLAQLRRMGQRLAVPCGAAGAADAGLRYAADRPCVLQHSLRHPVRGPQAAADGPESHRRGAGSGLHMDAGLLEGHHPGDQAGHRLRRADGVHHVHRRFHHQLLYGGHLVLHAGHDHLRHDQKARQPGDQRRVYAAVRHGHHPAGHHQSAGKPPAEPQPPPCGGRRSCAGAEKASRPGKEDRRGRHGLRNGGAADRHRHRRPQRAGGERVLLGRVYRRVPDHGI